MPKKFELTNDAIATIPLQTTDAGGAVVPYPAGETFSAVSSDPASLGADIAVAPDGVIGLVLTPLVEAATGLSVTISGRAGRTPATLRVDIVEDLSHAILVNTASATFKPSFGDKTRAGPGLADRPKTIAPSAWTPPAQPDNQFGGAAATAPPGTPAPASPYGSGGLSSNPTGAAAPDTGDPARSKRFSWPRDGDRTSAAALSPTDMTATTGADGSAALQCGNPDGAVAIQFYRTAQGVSLDGDAVKLGRVSTTGLTTTYTDYTADAGTYDYYATAFNGVGVESAPAGPATATVA